MLNKVGREIPEEILEATGKEVFQGIYYKDNTEFHKRGPITKVVMNHDTSKMVSSIHEALVKCGAHDGMTLGFHHHFRDGDLVVNMVMEEVHKMGIKDVTICASSLGKAHDALVPLIEDGTITNIQSSGVRGKIGEAISAGKLKGLAIMRSHGGRIRAIQTGETVIDISFIGAPTCDDYGNCKGIGGKSDCGVLSYSFVDGNHANKVVAVTDCLVPFPNYPADINMTKVDYVCVVDQIGVPEKIATGAAKPTTDVRKLMMADYCTQFVINTPYFKDGFSYQTGVGGASIASAASLGKIMKEREIKMSQLRPVSKTEKILFPIIIAVIISLLLPSAAPLIGCLMLGNLMKECGVVDRLSKTVQNELMNIVVIFLGITVGATATAEAFINVQTLSILVLGVLAFALGTAGGLLLAKFMNLFLPEGKKMNPLIGSAGVSAVPMAARVSQTVGQEANPSNFLLMHAMGPNVAGVVGSAVAAGILLSFLG